MKYTLGFSPCPNDTFMFDALVHQRLSGETPEFNVQLADIESLNEWALEGRLDVTKVSFHAYLRIRDHYRLLDSGAALGFGCGPLLISRRNMSDEEVINGTIAVPGKLTTANMLFSMRYPKATDKRYMIFSQIEAAVESGEADAGVIIHENRFTYQQHGLIQVTDLGTWWEQQTGLPIPLGAIVAHRRIGTEATNIIQQKLRDSVQYAFDHPRASLPFVRRHAQEMDDDVMLKHIETYVNSFSVSLGEVGRRAVDILHEKAINSGLIG